MIVMKIYKNTTKENNKSMKEYTTDVLIVGAGPVGLFANYQAGFLGMKTIVVDALDEIGGQLSALYPYKYIYDIPGFTKILAKDLVSNLYEQASQFNKEYLLKRHITNLVSNEDGSYSVHSSLNDVIHCKAIVLAAGAGAFGPNVPPIEGIESYHNKSVFYFVKNPDDFKDKTIVIAGGGDSAVDWAIGLSSVAKKIYVIHRRNQFRAAQSTVDQMYDLAKTGNIELVIPYQLDRLIGNNGMLESVVVKTLSGEEKIIEANCLLPLFGLSRSLGALEKWGFTINKMHSSIDVSPNTLETKLKGIYAVGDVASYEHKIKLITVGFAESASAVHMAWKYVFPNKVFHFVHSTSSKE